MATKHVSDTPGRRIPVGARVKRRERGASAVVVVEDTGDKRLSIACGFMGADRVLKVLPKTRAEVHAVDVGGLPYVLLDHLMQHVIALSQHQVAEAVGISTRTLRRQKDDHQKSMPTEVASKTWMFAETLAKASDVFGGREAAERWMSVPAMGLDDARPIELLRTLQGAELVNEFLERLDYGVYN